ncbi:thiaminase /4-amino-5-aminomethyl-2-methylpyrimidine deaminase [Knoellia remsis]|uniref:Thiaminase /4-amino-5-aminomethyl-2-methylpyrimidine deaminase n=1 Tax=Knoellia remsis TaxID=407159 RepID=A0A2T0V0L8_9MICO|nr:TenA family protein [Knoellia remsis]PRY63712.1 thiaminase /4-amino-5-aminomethyl-2-methylpyrimidine deaminase [Knoellia remsis]
MTFSDDAWAAIAPIREAIDRLPLLVELEAGTLDRAVFDEYLAQDAHYLASYGRALALAASQSVDPDHLVFWAESARGAVIVERELHAAHVADFGATSPSPTCTAYTSYLLTLGTRGCYPELIAGILPCFWIYDDVGRRLKESVTARGDLADHPFGDWIGTYGDPEFAASTARAREIVDEAAAGSSPDVVARMHDAFATAARYEWMFWDAPMRLETWPV